MILTRNLLSGITFHVGSSVVSKAIYFVTTLVIARYLGPVSLGIYGIFITAASSVTSFSLLGLPHAIQRYVARDWERNPESTARMITGGLILSLSANLVGAALLFGLSPWIAVRIFGNPHLTLWLRIASLEVLLGGVGTFLLGVIYGFQEYRRFGIFTSAASLVTLGLTLALVVRWRLLGAVAAYLLHLAITLAFSLWLVNQGLRKRGTPWSSESFAFQIGRLLSFGLPIALAGLFTAPASLWMQGILSQMAGLKEIGYIRAGQTMFNLVLFLPHVLSANMLTLLSEASGKEESSYFTRVAILNTRFTWILLLPMVIPLCIGMEPAMVLFFGETFQSAATIGTVIIWTALLVGLYGIAVQIYQALAKTWLLSLCSVLQPMIFLLAARTLVQRLMGVGYVLAELFSFAAVLAVMFLFMKRDVMTRGLESLGKLLGLTVVLAPAAILLQRAVPGFGLKILAALLAFAGVSAWLYRFHLSGSERRRILLLLARRPSPAGGA